MLRRRSRPRSTGTAGRWARGVVGGREWQGFGEDHEVQEEQEPPQHDHVAPLGQHPQECQAD
uniref:Uncharacterized protein n=1 Tax=Arundo donax TaxID=35708 RepID=A0A0A9B5S9_ARUDO